MEHETEHPKKLTSDFERSKIEAEAKVLFASASFSHSSSSRTFFKEESAKSTSILIKFKSRKDYWTDSPLNPGMDILHQYGFTEWLSPLTLTDLNHQPVDEIGVNAVGD